MPEIFDKIAPRAKLAAVMILQQLRQETAAQHSALEGLVPTMQPGFDRGGYIHLLKQFFGFNGPLEERLLAATKHFDIGLNYEERRKVPNLERDLRLLGESQEDIDQTPRCDELPPLENPQQLFGCLYVIEGSTLGGQYISRHLQQSLGLTPDNGVAFFSGYGAETGPRWKQFGEIITAWEKEHGGGDIIVANARRTFDAFAQWLRKTSSSPATAHA